MRTVFHPVLRNAAQTSTFPRPLGTQCQDCSLHITQYGCKPHLLKGTSIHPYLLDPLKDTYPPVCIAQYSPGAGACYWEKPGLLRKNQASVIHKIKLPYGSPEKDYEPKPDRYQEKEPSMPPLCPVIHLQPSLHCKTVPSLYLPGALPPAQEHRWVFKDWEIQASLLHMSLPS